MLILYDSMLHSNMLLLREFDPENLAFLMEDRHSLKMCSLINLEDSNLENSSAGDVMSRNSKNLLKVFQVDQQTIVDEVKLMLEENQVLTLDPWVDK